MTIVEANERDVHIRMRRRRRKIAEIRRSRVSGISKRVVIISAICLFIAFSGFIRIRGDGFTDTRSSYGAFAAEEIVYKKVTVYQGDTIWGIASTYTAPSEDVRKQVRAICDLNDVTPGKLVPGQVILVPISAHMA